MDSGFTNLAVAQEAPVKDEEILRKMAEIEGYEFVYNDDQLGLMFRPPAKDMSYWRLVVNGMPWNPLTNWSDLGALIERILSRDGPGWLEIAVGQQITTEGWKWSAEVDRSVDVPEICRIDDSLKRVICLAIIEAHK